MAESKAHLDIFPAIYLYLRFSRQVLSGRLYSFLPCRTRLSHITRGNALIKNSSRPVRLLRSHIHLVGSCIGHPKPFGGECPARTGFLRLATEINFAFRLLVGESSGQLLWCHSFGRGDILVAEQFQHGQGARANQRAGVQTGRFSLEAWRPGEADFERPSRPDRVQAL
jgi:hypothetical protein